MNSPDVLAIAASWSFWERPIPHSVRRNINLPDALHDSHCLVIQGVRRCGKSTLLQQLIDHYGLDPLRCAFINFEDPRLSSAQSYEVLDQLVEQFRERHPAAGRLYFFLDEIQGVAGWQRWLRAQLDRPCGNIFVITGSNATLLSGELSSVL
ncbi:MAG: AAA family ATPase, partial [Deltaproteobacteria bacterium]|nr:AAA family ATPase [Deltaproteobacteria bacterium]